jgi:DNA-binding NtrC family response regulator
VSHVLVVTQGANLGARLVLDERVRRIGRASDADLYLPDPVVSRGHLEVAVQQGEVHVRCVPGAAPFFVDALARTEVHLKPGQMLLVGNTVLALNEVTSSPTNAGSTQLEVTDTIQLLSGHGADVRGLSSVFALVEALESVDRRSALEGALDAWARTNLGVARAVALTDPSVVARLETLAVAVEANWVGGPRVLVRCTAPDIVGVSFEFHPNSTIDEASSRLAAVAARIFGAFASEKENARNAREDLRDLRTLAVGSATDFLGTSEPARQVAALLPKLAASDATVLLLGESGVGKTFVARLIHEASRRVKAPLRVINCAAIPENLVESELFGHERGAFTGADAARAGAFESAGEGTVLLDEIGELPLSSQAKLLRVLEDKQFERIGSRRALPLRARVIAATNRDLKRLAEDGRFRNDLYFRVSVVTVRVPSLRERADDIALLADRILQDLAATAGRRVVGFSEPALAAIRAYPWPGNVRELRNAVEHALVLGESAHIMVSDLPEPMRLAPEILGRPPNAASRSGGEPMAGEVVTLPANLQWLEERAIEVALRVTRGNRTHAAALLGINRATLYKKFPVAGT